MIHNTRVHRKEYAACARRFSLRKNYSFWNLSLKQNYHSHSVAQYKWSIKQSTSVNAEPFLDNTINGKKWKKVDTKRKGE